jgi:hypothetical protein
MKYKNTKIFIISLIIVLTLVNIALAKGFKLENADIQKLRENEESAKLAVEVFKMTDDVTYQAARNNLKDILEDKVYQTYFPLPNWTIADRNRLSLTINDLRVNLKEAYVEFNIKGQGYNENKVALINFNEAGKITNIALI